MGENKGIGGQLLSIAPGFLMLAVTLWVLRTYVEPWMNSYEIFHLKGWLVKVLSLNYILLSILAGIFYRNVLFGGKIPAWADPGFRTTRLFIKAGVIMLGSLYTLQNLVKFGATAATLIVIFVFATIGLVLFLGTKVFKADRSVTAVMAAACGVCGVSAAVAASPGVRAKPVDLALSVATILGFGIATMFISPFIGKAIGMSDAQFGAWVGTGILNSGQVLATCLAFNPHITEGSAVYYGEIWNVIRVITIPFVVFLLSIWYWRNAEDEDGTGGKISLGKIFMTKFPVFVLGFFGMTIMSSLGWLGASGSETLHLTRELMQWIFGIGLVGLGAFIDVREIKAAGGKPLRIGLIAGTTKYVLALIIVLLFVAKDGKL